MPKTVLQMLKSSSQNPIIKKFIEFEIISVNSQMPNLSFSLQEYLVKDEELEQKRCALAESDALVQKLTLQLQDYTSRVSNVAEGAVSKQHSS